MTNALTDTVLIINSKDNVGVALRDLKAGERVVAAGEERFPLLEDIPASHKVALKDIGEAEEIIKYGETVGVSTKEIKRGSWVHTHNLESRRWKK